MMNRYLVGLSGMFMCLTVSLLILAALAVPSVLADGPDGPGYPGCAGNGTCDVSCLAAYPKCGEAGAGACAKVSGNDCSLCNCKLDLLNQLCNCTSAQ